MNTLNETIIQVVNEDTKGSLKHLKKMMSLTKDLMREINALEKTDEDLDLHDQITTMQKNVTSMRDVITRSGKILPR